MALLYPSTILIIWQMAVIKCDPAILGETFSCLHVNDQNKHV